MQDSLFVRAIATCLLAGQATVEAATLRLERTLGQSWKRISPLADRYVRTFSGNVRPRRREIIRFLRTDRGFQRACAKHRREWEIAHWIVEPQRMLPVFAASNWQLPVIESVGALAEWLALSTGDLLWFADLKGLVNKQPEEKLRHYYYRVLPKQNGSLRIIESPKSRLKTLQRQILSQILKQIPPHPAAHGFLKGRSIRTFVAPHVGKRVVLRMDLQDFFTSIQRARIQALFRTLGYPEDVADLLGAICTTTTPRNVWANEVFGVDRNDSWHTKSLYSIPHLPQGAPTSPALANFCIYRADCRLTALASTAGAAYSRYADDVAFSGDAEFERRVGRFSLHAAAILMEEGFRVHHRKTRVMRQGVRQHLVGLVTNRKLNVMRADFDRLKATLTNCVRFGPAGQNRDSHLHFREHLNGLVAFVESVNSSKGARLRSIFDRIRWD